MSQNSENIAFDSLLFENNKAAKTKLKKNEPPSKVIDSLYTNYPQNGGISYKQYNNKVTNIYLEKIKKFMKKNNNQEQDENMGRPMTVSEKRNQNKTTQQIVNELLGQTSLQVNDIEKKKKQQPNKNSTSQSKKQRKKDIQNQKQKNKNTISKPQVKRRPKKEDKVVETKSKPLANKKSKPKIDIRTFSLKKLIGILSQKKVCGASLNYKLYPNLLGNQEQFVKLYGQSKLSKNYFNICTVTPFDHRLFARILEHLAPKEYQIYESSTFKLAESRGQIVDNFYYNLYHNLSETQYYKRFLEFELNYGRKSVRKFRRIYYEPSITRVLRQQQTLNESEGATEQEIREYQQQIKNQRKSIQFLKSKLNQQQRQQQMVQMFEEQIRFNKNQTKINKTSVKFQEPYKGGIKKSIRNVCQDFIPQKDILKTNFKPKQAYYSNKFHLQNQPIYESIQSRNRKNVLVQQQKGSDYCSSSQSSYSSYSSGSSLSQSGNSIQLQRKIKKKYKRQYSDISNSDSYMKSSSSDSQKADPDDLSLQSGLNSGEQSFIDEIVSSNQSKKQVFSPILVPIKKQETGSNSEQSFELSNLSQSL